MNSPTLNKFKKQQNFKNVKEKLFFKKNMFLDFLVRFVL